MDTPLTNQVLSDYKAKILIVDDTPENIDLLIQILEPDGYKIVFAGSGEKAVNIAPRSLPDIILMDVMMPGIDGFEACRQLMKIKSTQNIPVIFITAKRDQADITEGFDAGGVDYITKPVHAGEVKARINTHITLHLHKTRLTELVQSRTAELAAKKNALEMANLALTDSNKQYKIEVEQRKKTEQHLRDTQEEVAELAHMAGMSMIATDIIHNIGNILTGISGHCNSIYLSLKESQLNCLDKANTMLSDNADALDLFFTVDPRGKKLLTYYQYLAEILHKEQTGLTENTTRLKQLINVMAEVIQTQQEYANNGSYSESLQAADLVENSLQLCHGMSKENIIITRQYQDVSNISVQKVKFVQILMNLLKNAKESMLEMKQNKHKEIQIEIKPQSSQWVAICIKDNGLGVSPENLTKIFTHGFTTKELGHGFGLHYCANALTEMNGKLTVESDGFGKGATFIALCPVSTK